MERVGSNETKARRSLRDALAKQTGQRTSLDTGSRFKDAASLYLEQIQTRRSGTTYDRYKGRLDKHVLPAIARPRLARLRFALLLLNPEGCGPACTGGGRRDRLSQVRGATSRAT